MLGISFGGAVFVPKRSTFVPVLSTRNFVKFHFTLPVLPLCTCRSNHAVSYSVGMIASEVSDALKF